MDFTNKRILKLTLDELPFLLMVNEWKLNEYRKPSDWIMSRLRNADGSPKMYDYILFTNGYGAHRPFFYCQYLGWYPAEVPTIEEYSNNVGKFLRVHVAEDDIIIPLGIIVKKGNLKK